MKTGRTTQSNLQRCLLALILCAVSACTNLNAEETEFWITVNTPSFDIGDFTKSKTHIELRYPEAEYWNYFRVSQKFSHKLGDWTLGTSPVLEGSRKEGESAWTRTYRFDLELNPKKFKLGENGPTLALRNRWELRWKQGKGSEIFHRIRQYSTLTWKLDGKPFTSYGIGDEIFYETDKSKFTMNRFYPALLGVNMIDGVSSTVFLLYQSKRIGTTDNWSDTYIAGLTLSF